MKRIALFFLLVLGVASIVVGMTSSSRVVLSPDIPPPSCAPDCPESR
jgi:hypothetical protein